MKEGTMKRLLKMLWSKYKIHLIVVFLCIVGNALFNVQGTMFMQTLIDDYIVPLLKSSSPDFSDYSMLCSCGCTLCLWCCLCLYL